MRSAEPGADHLTVDVWAPSRPVAPAPVVVFVHGGAFIAGSPRGAVYDGAAFARDGVVLVTVTYRLGVAGFLHLPGAPDNRGRLDVLAALVWVQENIARFGGDPGRVTVAGQSAGAMLVASVAGAPDARDTHRRAIVQSGSGTAAFTPEQADPVRVALGRELRTEPTVAGLADATDEQLVAVVPRLMGLDLTTGGARDPLGGRTPFGLVLDQQPAESLAARGPSEVDLLIGSTLGESRLYLAPVRELSDSTEADLLATAGRFHPAPERLLVAYRAARPAASVGELHVALLGDGLFGAGTRRFADAHARTGGARTFVYEFTWRSDALDGELGACHLVELPFVFDTVDVPALHGPGALLGESPPPAGLAARMHAAWVRFAAHGDPGWPAYSPAAPVVQEIGRTWRAVEGLHREEHRAWTG